MTRRTGKMRFGLPNGAKQAILEGRKGGCYHVRSCTSLREKRYDRAIIDPVSCTGCGYCTMFCVMDCILLQPDGFYTVDLDRCIGCRSCKVNCPFEAVIILPPKEDA